MAAIESKSPKYIFFICRTAVARLLAVKNIVIMREWNSIANMENLDWNSVPSIESDIVTVLWIEIQLLLWKLQ